MSRKPSCYRRHLKDSCEFCGFVPITPSQLDIHHWDHNKENDHPDNLETVCANCHRVVHANPDTIDVSTPYGQLARDYVLLKRKALGLQAAWFYQI